MVINKLRLLETTKAKVAKLEQAIRSAPDVIVDGAVEAGDLAALLADAGLAAAREGRVVRVRDESLLRPGPGTGRAALDLADEIRRVAADLPTRP